VSHADRIKSESVKLEALAILRDAVVASVSSSDPRSALEKIVEQSSRRQHDGLKALILFPFFFLPQSFSIHTLALIALAKRQFTIDTGKEQTERRVMVRFKVRADQAPTNEQEAGYDDPG
jgi:hypothetical protein